MVRRAGRRAGYRNTEQFAAYINIEIARWGKVIREAGIKAEERERDRDDHNYGAGGLAPDDRWLPYLEDYLRRGGTGAGDDLASGPKHYAELATQSGTNAQGLYRLLRALSSVGVFEQIGEQRFALNPRGALLRKDAPGSLRAWQLQQPDVSELGRARP